MYKYNHLLKNASEQLNILKGDCENEEQYKSRIIYSIAARMAYASLWDELEDWDIDEDGVPISIVHFKRRIERIINSYKNMYPEISDLLPDNLSEISNTIYSIFGSTGIFYHSAYRIRPSIDTSRNYYGIEYKRGCPISDRIAISGSGMFAVTEIKNNDPHDVQKMFGLCNKQLESSLDHLISESVFEAKETDDSFEYLNTEPPFTNGYWVTKPNKKIELSLAKKSSLGKPDYYFYKNTDRLLFARLPEWVTNPEPVCSFSKTFLYGQLSNAILKKCNTLPKIKYMYDGAIVRVRLEYLLPPNEMNFVLLYSWPEKYHETKNVFNRILDKRVFDSIRKILEVVGYSFKEE